MAFLVIVAGCLLSAAVFLSVVFAVTHRRRRYDLIDAAWGPTFIVVASAALVFSPQRSAIGWVTVTLVGIWGIRLAWHIFSRWRRSDAEDPRYVELRRSWPQKWIGAQIFVRIYVVQAMLATLVSLPVIVIIYTHPAITALTFVGIFIWIVGFVFESRADAQLKAYLHAHAGSGGLMTSGLWRYSRHPNYFGEIMQWWGIGIIALTTPLWGVSLVGPVTITILICFVSGIPPAERRARQKTGWDEYQRSTSVLVPWFKR